MRVIITENRHLREARNGVEHSNEEKTGNTTAYVWKEFGSEMYHCGPVCRLALL